MTHVTHGPLAGLSVLELASEWGAYAGKLLAELGAEVVLVEPPEGHHTRRYGPFAGDEADPDGSLWFWHYHTSKRGVTVDVDTPSGREVFRSLLDGADVLLEGEPPGRLDGIGLGYAQLSRSRPELIMVSITPFGQRGPRCDEPATDLTLLATGGPVWSCGYDDHRLPPVRGAGNQAVHIGGHFAVMALLVAVIDQEAGGTGQHIGQHIDINLNAAANVTTEFASYSWLAARQTVQRQTGRHATPSPTQPTQVQCGDGRWLNTGVLPRRPRDFAVLLDWLEELGLADEFPLASLLEAGSKAENVSPLRIADDPMIAEIFTASREATALIASRLAAYDAFVGFQQRGIPVGIVYSPEEVMQDPHFVARGFPVTVDDVTYPGAPYRFSRTPWALKSRAPRLGEHNALLTGGEGEVLVDGSDGG